MGDWVWLRLHQRLAASIIDKSAGKLAPRFYGPYRVLERIGPVAYKLELPPRSRIHSVFHVVFLKKYVGAPPAEIVQLPPINHGRVLPAPAKAIRARLNRGNWEVLIQWIGRPAGDATWEKLTEFTQEHVEFQLEDELFRKEGGKCCGRVCWAYVFQAQTHGSY